ncbi:MAG: Tn3 family transposase [Cyanobacteria bacterium P01_G01_bin.38]
MRGEALHSLRSLFIFANQGELRSQQDEQLHSQVGCLNLVTNAIIVWNTVPTLKNPIFNSSI